MKRPAATLLFVIAAACGGGGGEESPAEPDAAPAAPDADTPTWTSFARSFFESYCWSCHGPGDSLRDFSQLSMVRAESARIRAGIDDGTFPVGNGPEPTRDERDRLILWIDSDTPE